MEMIALGKWIRKLKRTLGIKKPVKPFKPIDMSDVTVDYKDGVTRYNRK